MELNEDFRKKYPGLQSFEEHREKVIKECERLGTQKVREKDFAGEYDIYTEPVVKAWLEEKKSRVNLRLAIVSLVIGAIGVIATVVSLFTANKTKAVNAKLISDRSHIRQLTQIAQQNNYYLSSPDKIKTYIKSIEEASGDTVTTNPNWGVKGEGTP